MSPDIFKLNIGYSDWYKGSEVSTAGTYEYNPTWYSLTGEVKPSISTIFKIAKYRKNRSKLANL